MTNPYLVCSARELRALPIQWMRAERWDEVGHLLCDLEFMEASAGRLGIDALLEHYTLALHALPETDERREKLAQAQRILVRSRTTVQRLSASLSKGPQSSFRPRSSAAL